MSNVSKNCSVLFICHESSRTGAPVVLLNLLKWIRGNKDISTWIIINKGGELDHDFERLAPTLILKPARSETLPRKITRKFKGKHPEFRKIRKFVPDNITLVYSNTAANGDLLDFIKRYFKCPIITHLHELENVIRSLGNDNLKHVLKNTDYYIAASEKVKDYFCNNHQVSEDAICVVHEFISPPDSLTGNHPVLPIGIRINKEDFVVGSVGFVDYRKGFDLFLETASAVINEPGIQGVKFLWVGEFGHGRKKITENYLKRHHLEDMVAFTGGARNPYGYYSLFNIFFLASREDPFPLVMLESSWFGKPVMAFRNSGGAAEFIDENSGILLDDYDPGKAAEWIIHLKDQREYLLNLGNHARDKINESFLTDKLAPVIFDKILKISGKEAGNLNIPE